MRFPSLSKVIGASVDCEPATNGLSSSITHPSLCASRMLSDACILQRAAAAVLPRGHNSADDAGWSEGADTGRQRYGLCANGSRAACIEGAAIAGCFGDHVRAAPQRRGGLRWAAVLSGSRATSVVPVAAIPTSRAQWRRLESHRCATQIMHGPGAQSRNECRGGCGGYSAISSYPSRSVMSRPTTCPDH